MEWDSKTAMALHHSLVELTLRLSRVEEKLGLSSDQYPLATFARPCSCEEALQLRAELTAVTSTLDICRRERGKILDQLAALESRKQVLEPAESVE